MNDVDSAYDLEISEDGIRWRPLPMGYRQDGTVADRIGGVVVQNVGRGRVVYYRAVPAADDRREERAS